MFGSATSGDCRTAAVRTITSLGALCHARRTECVRLSAFRDALLPLLISGKVRVAR